MAPNVGYLFYKEYYKGLLDNDWHELVTSDEPELSEDALQHIKKINQQIEDSDMSSYSSLPGIFPINSGSLSSSFDLKTTYPGLLTGSGWDHSAGNIVGEFKLGLYFDYTTGLPVIPGSSVKGALRSAFGHSDYIKELLSKQDISGMDVALLEKEIFEGMSRGAGPPLPISKRDIFFDAYPVRTKNHGNRFLGEDYITPHKDQYTNPIPIKFLKVIPEVVFRFQFGLKDGLITAKEKISLFKDILLDIGVGAKTSVGYGHLEDVVDSRNAAATKKQMQKEKEQKEVERQERLMKMSPVDRLFEKHNKDINTIINAMRKNQADLNDSDRIEAAERIKSIMVKKKIWERPKKPKDKKRVKYIKTILGD